MNVYYRVVPANDWEDDSYCSHRHKKISKALDCQESGPYMRMDIIQCEDTPLGTYATAVVKRTQRVYRPNNGHPKRCLSCGTWLNARLPGHAAFAKAQQAQRRKEN